MSARIYYMSDGYIYETSDGEFYGRDDLGARVWSDPYAPGGALEDNPEEYEQIAWQVIPDPRPSSEIMESLD